VNVHDVKSQDNPVGYFPTNLTLLSSRLDDSAALERDLAFPDLISPRYSSASGMIYLGLDGPSNSVRVASFSLWWAGDDGVVTRAVGEGDDASLLLLGPSKKYDVRNSERDGFGGVDGM